eukprot:PhF_6_TR5396/c0_g1_i2/m.7711
MAKSISIRVDLLVLLLLVVTSGVFIFGDSFTGPRPPTPTSSVCPSSLEAEKDQIIQSYLRRLIVESPAGSGIAAGIPPLSNPFPTSENVTVSDLERVFPPPTVIAQAVEGNVSLIALADSGGLEALPEDPTSEAGGAPSPPNSAIVAGADAMTTAKE